MRVSREVMERHHQEIVAAGAKLLRERGIEGLSVADVMKAVGLTHGGFYRHFGSKEEFVREATKAAFSQVGQLREEGAPATEPTAQLTAATEFYLSKAHLDNPAGGCPIAAFGTDATRVSDTLREPFADGVQEMLDWVEERMPGTRKAKARSAELVSLMVGAVVTARSTGDPELATQILDAARSRARELIERDIGPSQR